MDGRAVGEYFEVFDDDGQPLGFLPRAAVHRLGCWHRSANVWVYRSDGRLLMQRRADGKDLFPGCWDYSVGEHLRPGESYLDGARRGLAEELGIEVGQLDALGDVRSVVTVDPERGIHDREFSRSFRCIHDDDLHPDTAEVAQWCWMQPAQIADWMAREPAAFTPWFIEAGAVLGLIPPESA